jgi:hypothetical protein
MELKAKVVSILEVQTGEGKNGEWKKGGYVVETDGDYPKKVAIDLFNDKLDNCPKVGDIVTSHLNIESREFNGKWYTNVGAWRIDKGNDNETPKVDEESQNLPF